MKRSFSRFFRGVVASSVFLLALVTFAGTPQVVEAGVTEPEFIAESFLVDAPGLETLNVIQRIVLGRILTHNISGSHKLREPSGPDTRPELLTLDYDQATMAYHTNAASSVISAGDIGANSVKVQVTVQPNSISAFEADRYAALVDGGYIKELNAWDPVFSSSASEIFYGTHNMIADPETALGESSGGIYLDIAPAGSTIALRDWLTSEGISVDVPALTTLVNEILGNACVDTGCTEKWYEYQIGSGGGTSGLGTIDYTTSTTTITTAVIDNILSQEILNPNAVTQTIRIFDAGSYADFFDELVSSGDTNIAAITSEVGIVGLSGGTDYVTQLRIEAGKPTPYEDPSTPWYSWVLDPGSVTASYLSSAFGSLPEDPTVAFGAVTPFTTSFTATAVDAELAGESESSILSSSGAEDSGLAVERAILGFLDCSFPGQLNVAGCLTQGLYYLGYQPSSVLVYWAGSWLDTFANYSISSKIYRDSISGSSFIGAGWTIVRDISNIIFIFGLIYVAFSLVLQMTSANTKRIFVTIVVIALMMNFSLFLSRIIIDAGNIIARAFYNQITVTGVGDEADATTVIAGTGIKEVSLSRGLAAGLNIQHILTRETLDLMKSQGKGAGFIAIFLLYGIGLNLVATWAFLTGGLLFLGRIIGLWFVMIASPLAFVSLAIPKMRSIKFVGFDWWLKTLTNLSFLGAVFMFFIYLVMVMIQIDFFKDFLESGEAANFWVFLLRNSIPFMMIIGLLIIARKIAVQMAGEVGGIAVSIADKIQGAALTVGKGALIATGAGAAAAGGAALRGTVGKYAYGELQNEKLKERARKGDLDARLRLGAADFLSRRDFDVRRTGQGIKGLGEAAREGLLPGGFGDSGKGGFAGVVERRGKRAELSKARYQLTSARSAEDQNRAYDEWESTYQGDLVSYLADYQNKTNSSLPPSLFRKLYENGLVPTVDSSGTILPVSADPSKLNLGEYTADQWNNEAAKDKADALEFGDDFVAARKAAKKKAQAKEQQVIADALNKHLASGKDLSSFLMPYDELANASWNETLWRKTAGARFERTSDRKAQEAAAQIRKTLRSEKKSPSPGELIALGKAYNNEVAAYHKAQLDLQNAFEHMQELGTNADLQRNLRNAGNSKLADDMIDYKNKIQNANQLTNEELKDIMLAFEIAGSAKNSWKIDGEIKSKQMLDEDIKVLDRQLQNAVDRGASEAQITALKKKLQKYEGFRRKNQARMKFISDARNNEVRAARNIEDINGKMNV